MNSLTVKILAALVSVLLITTICSQVYYFVHDKHDTEEAVLATVNEDILLEGIIVRDEQVVTYNGGGVLDYKYADGSKVSVNNTIAEVFPSEEAIEIKNRISRIDDQIEQLQRAQNPSTTASAEPEALLSGIKTGYEEMMDAIDEKDYATLASIKKDMAFSSNLYSIIAGSQSDFNDTIGKLQAQRTELKKSASTPEDIIKAQKTGYFVSYADGYESQLTTENADKLTESDIKNVLEGKAKAPEGAIGKMFDSYSCKIVGIINRDARVTEDAQLSLMLNSSKSVYDCSVESVKLCGEYEDKMIVVLTCDRLDEALVESRKLSAKLIFDEYEGIKVPREAIRFQGDQKGVYVILGKDISFKKINVIYEGDDFVLSENTSDDKYLLLYDQILLEVVSNNDVSDSSTAKQNSRRAGK